MVAACIRRGCRYRDRITRRALTTATAGTDQRKKVAGTERQQQRQRCQDHSQMARSVHRIKCIGVRHAHLLLFLKWPQGSGVTRFYARRCRAHRHTERPRRRHRPRLRARQLDWLSAGRTLSSQATRSSTSNRVRARMMARRDQGGRWIRPDRSAEVLALRSQAAPRHS